MSFTAYLMEPDELTTIAVWQIPRLKTVLILAVPRPPSSWLTSLTDARDDSYPSAGYTEVFFDLLIHDDASAIYVRRKDPT